MTGSHGCLLNKGWASVPQKVLRAEQYGKSWDGGLCTLGTEAGSPLELGRTFQSSCSDEVGNLRESKQATCPGRQLGMGERADDKELSSYGDEEGGGVV